MKIKFNLTWINEMQIEHVFVNVNKGRQFDHSPLYFEAKCLNNRNIAIDRPFGQSQKQNKNKS